MINVTSSAIFRINEMKRMNEENEEAMLHFGVSGGGCSGLTYNLSFKDEILDQTEILEIENLKIMIEKKDIPVLKGTEIDFKESLMGGGFIINNPNAILSCGCGTSFRTEKNLGKPEVCE